ncbi:MAG: pyruvate ferredoxin oxidoreductase subunit gamma [Actinobacteria bacterium]|nr:pyruvate ferredoxin oxidoreductase subunit gamma [Actinomycetota bacterium]
MTEIRWHGRGGQGAVASAEMFAIAAIEEGKSAQAFPSFGPERRGAPVMAFTRVSDEFIHLRTGITEPDVVVVLDPTVMSAVDVTAGLKDGGIVVANTSKGREELAKEFNITARLATVNAGRIAHEEIGRPITNTTMLGALVKVTGLVGLDSLAEQIEKRFPGVAEKNIKAMRRAYEETEV